MLEKGFYLLCNTEHTNEKIWRVVEVLNIENDFYHNGILMKYGVYILMTGCSSLFPISYFDDWKNVHFYKIKIPT